VQIFHRALNINAHGKKITILGGFEKGRSHIGPQSASPCC
jgi:hypothetical protein